MTSSSSSASTRRRKLTNTVCGTSCTNLARECVNAAGAAVGCPAAFSHSAYYPASLAVDGDTDQSWPNVASTNSVVSPWWKVTLQEPNNKIEEIVIYGRNDCCNDPISSNFRWDDLTVEVLDYAGNTVHGPLTWTASNFPSDVVLRFDLQQSNVVGQIVKVSIKNSNAVWFSLGEVEVWGKVAPAPYCPNCINLARSCSSGWADQVLGAPACSTFMTNPITTNPSSMGVDGILGDPSNYFHTGSGPGMEWEVALQRGSQPIHNEIHHIVLYNRGETIAPARLNGSTLGIYATGHAAPVATEQLNGDLLQQFFFNPPVVGDVVKISNPSAGDAGILHLREVEVYGEAVIGSTTDAPSHRPSSTPSQSPSLSPSTSPSFAPSTLPSISFEPSADPTISAEPSAPPTLTSTPSSAPTASSVPSAPPTALDSDTDGVPDTDDDVRIQAVLLFMP